MALNTSHAAVLALRRELLAKWRLHGLTQRELVAILAKRMEDGQPARITVSLAAVNRDLKALERGWRARAAEAIGARKARQLAEIDEAKRRAWLDNDLQALARFIKLESDIFGTNAPSRQEHSG